MLSEPFDPEAQTAMVFESQDLDLLNFAVNRVPELCIGVWAAKRRRELGLQYPLDDADGLTQLMAGRDFVGGGYCIRPQDVPRYFPAVFFPVNSDEDLIRKVRMSLVRANTENGSRKSQEPGWGSILEGGKQ